MLSDFFKRNYYFVVIISTVILLSVGSPELLISQNASAPFRVSPQRILLDNEEFGVINVQNSSEVSGEFRVEVRHMIADENGQFEQASEEDLADAEWPLNRNLRFGPRRFALEPGERQAVRIATRFPPDQADGEYRGHVAVVRIPDDNSSSSSAEGSESENLSVKLRFNQAIAVPVRVWKGELDIPVVEVEDVSVPTNPEASSEISMRFTMQGTRTVAGNVDVYYQQNGSSERQKINTRSPRVAIYPELPVRNLTIPIQDVQLASDSTLRIVYSGEENGEEYIYVQEVIEI